MEVAQAEVRLLHAKSCEQRKYLMDAVMPQVMMALVECCGTQPDDPIKWIATHMLNSTKENN